MRRQAWYWLKYPIRKLWCANTSPDVHGSRPASSDRNELLPAPLSPTMPMRAVRGMSITTLRSVYATGSPGCGGPYASDTLRACSTEPW